MDSFESAKKVKLALLFAALALCFSVFPSMPYAFWVLLKWAVFGAALFTAMKLKDEERLRRHLVPLIILAVLFNPLIPVVLTPLLRLMLSLGTAIYFLTLSKKI